MTGPVTETKSGLMVPYFDVAVSGYNSGQFPIVYLVKQEWNDGNDIAYHGQHRLVGLLLKPVRWNVLPF